MKLSSLLFASALAATLLANPMHADAIGVDIYYRDAEGVGFNDPVLGSARRTAFEAAMQHVANNISGPVPISIDAYFYNGLGAAWGYDEGYPNTLWRDFANAIPGIYYPQSLAKQIAGYDLNPGSSDMTLVFNADLDSSRGTYGERFYYGLDGLPGNDVDFFSIALHAFGRGVGFYSLLEPRSGEYQVLPGDAFGYPDIMTAFLASSKKPYWYKKSRLLITLPPKKRAKAAKSKNGLRWSGWALTTAAGQLVPMYAPKVKKKSPLPYGVVDHFAPEFGIAEVMWPYYRWFAVHNLGAARFAMADMGWSFY